MRQKDGRLSRQIRQRYELCLLNLLVKRHLDTVAPADAFHYNTHVGLDVGGRHNNRVMACLGHGFANPNQGLVFRPEEIPLDTRKAEPIPTTYLYIGLLRLFEMVRAEVMAANHLCNFERTLFFRDGPL